MIRKFVKEDLDRVMELWLRGNRDAHAFVDKGYWEKACHTVREEIPRAEVFVYDEGGFPMGFIGLSKQYVAGLFVEKQSRSRGIGKALLDHAKRNFPALSLRVYQKNQGALRFYQREGFVISKERTDPFTGQREAIMKWERSSRSGE